MSYHQPQPPFQPPPGPPSTRPAPKWARKRFVLPALGLAFIIGVGSAGAAGQNPDATKPVANDKVQPTVTATATPTATQTVKPKPAPTVTATKTVQVKVTVTAHAAADSGTEESSTSDGSSSSGGSNSSGGSSSDGGGATARCNDGTYSYAVHHQGACSHHGGVAVFYR
ncbi:DUF3761 domain-containing protein [Streptomyces sp. NPDC021356]|uniref:DUF3761 domain-containing protein n=1 Tax=Streptomyces sp. NPDC021356 TaxID=3154900 RepID=UPI0033D71FD9